MNKLANLVLIMCCFMSAGCATLQPAPSGYGGDPTNPQPPPPILTPECESYDSNYALWGGVAAGAGALAGMNGLVTTLPDDEGARLALGISTLVVGGVSATSVFLSQHYAKRYTEHCTSPSK